MEKTTTIETQILKCLDQLRGFLQAHSGDIEFVRFSDGIAYLRFSGACVGCSLQDSTLKDGIETFLMREVSGVIRVEKVT